MPESAETSPGLPHWLPRRLLLAVDIMVDIAFNGSGGPVPAVELAARRGVETRRLEAVLQRLSRAGLLKSLRGPNGGYLLGGERTGITLRMIAEAVSVGDEPETEAGGGSDIMRKVVQPQAARWHQVLLEEMAKSSLADLCRHARLAGLESKYDGVVDFVI